MAVGSGSIKRVKKAAAEIQGDVPVVEGAAVEVKTEVKEEAPKKKAPAKKPTTKKTTTAKSAEDKPKAAKKAAPEKAEVKKDNIHEKKFEVVSNIKSDLPYYLL